MCGVSMSFMSVPPSSRQYALQSLGQVRSTAELACALAVNSASYRDIRVGGWARRTDSWAAKRANPPLGLDRRMREARGSKLVKHRGG